MSVGFDSSEQRQWSELIQICYFSVTVSVFNS